MLRHSFVVFMFLATLFVQAQIVLDSPVTLLSSDIDRPNSMALLDITGNGLNDLVVASANEQELVWFENLGAGEFGTMHVLHASNGTANKVVTKDTDNDGDLDLIATVTTELIHFENNGMGGLFPTDTLTTVIGSLSNIVVEDLNNDGYYEMVMKAGSLVFLASIVNGQLSSTTLPTSSLNPQNIEVADLNGDGFSDILFTTVSSLWWIENLMGSYQGFALPLVLTSLNCGVSGIYIHDLDNNGLVEVVYSCGTVNTEEFYIKDLTSDPFSIEVDSLSGANNTLAPGGKSFESADLNNDGLNDIINASYSTGRLGVYYNLGNCEFDNWQPLSSSNERAHFFLVEDVNGDSLNDVVFAQDLISAIAWYPNNGSGNFSDSEYIIDPVPLGFDIEFEDLDNDGIRDMIVLGELSFIYKGLGNRQYGDFYLIGEFDFARRVSVEDFDGDGLADLFLSGRDSSALFLNQGALNFEEVQVFETIQTDAFDDGSYSVMDLDGDNDQEIVAYSESDLTLELFEFDGSAFKDPIVLDSNDDPLSAGIIDVDNDGFEDIVYGLDGFHVFWMRNLGGLDFDTPNILLTLTGCVPFRVDEVLDFNLDGFDDLVYLCTNFNRYELMRNIPGGTVVAEGEIETNFGAAKGVVLSDFDGDGDIDQVLNKISLIFFENDDGFADEGLILNSELNQEALVAVDIDGDQDVDLVGCDGRDVLLFENSPGIPEPTVMLNPNFECWENQVLNTTNASLASSSFFWNFGDGFTSQEYQPAHVYAESGVYDLSLVLCNTEGCDTTHWEFHAKEIGFNIPENANVGDSIFFDNQSFGFDNFTWVFGDNEVSQDESPTHAYTEPGNYVVEVFLTDSEIVDCTYTEQFNIEISESTSIEEIDQPAFQIHPNPSSEQFLLSGQQIEKGQYTLYNTVGKQVQNGKFEALPHAIDISANPSGIYYLEVSSENERVILKATIVD